MTKEEPTVRDVIFFRGGGRGCICPNPDLRKKVIFCVFAHTILFVFSYFAPPPSRKSVKILPPLDKTEMTSLLYVCVFVFVCLHACMFCVCVCVCLLICVHVCLFVCACLCVYVCVTAVYPRVSVSKDSDTCTQFDHTVGQGGTSQDHRP